MIIQSSLFCSKSLILKKDHEWLAHIALYKRVTWANRSRHSIWVICSLFEQCEWFACYSSIVSDWLVIQVNRSQKTSNSSKNSYFLYVFDSFSSFYAQVGIDIISQLSPILWDYPFKPSYCIRIWYNFIIFRNLWSLSYV